MDISVRLTTYPGLDDRIVIVRAGDEVDAVFVRTDRFNVLVDTLGTPSLCREALALLDDQMGDRPLLVINSHMDWDHFWGNSGLGDRIPIIAHAKALERLNDPAARDKLVEKQRDGRFRDVEIVAPNICFTGESMILDGGDLVLELLHTPGHTPDHVAVWIPSIRTCLAVDAVEWPIPEVWSKDPHDLKALCCSLKTIRDLDARHVVLAHGQTSAPSIVEANLAYFSRLHDRIAALDGPALANADLDQKDGLRLRDFLSLPEDMPGETVAFYERCHRSNLYATAEARKAGVAYI
jgi:glyoxylase-like metal-dependent hydrolase (beta-lactamase superfamily II)